MKHLLIHTFNWLYEKDFDILAVASAGIWGIAEHLELGIKICIGLASLGYILWKWRHEYKKAKP